MVNINSGIHYNEIWYTTSDGNIVTPYNIAALPFRLSNTYVDGKGIIKFNTNVKSIGFQAFYNCRSLTSVTIPNKVTSIGEQAFYVCPLISINIPNKVTSIGRNAFYGCSLTSITIPDSVKSIEWGAFGLCTKLTNISYEGTISQWSTIYKGDSWNREVPATVVHCTDGDVEL